MAHTYSTDSAERRYLPLAFALVAIAAAFGTFQGLRYCGVELPWWLSPPDTMMFYGLSYLLFDKIVWRWRWVRKLGVTKIPDLTGTWQGQVLPTATGGSAGLTAPADITVTIQQSWSEISIRARSAQSQSRSLSAQLIVLDEHTLTYEYLNEPSVTAPTTMHVHRGTAWLSLEEGETSLRGEYYSGRDRQNIGVIRLKRVGVGTTEPTRT